VPSLGFFFPGECLLFKHLDASGLKVIVDAMFKVEVGPEDVIIKQGDDGDNFYVMEGGHVEIFVKQPDGSQLKVMTCSVGAAGARMLCECESV
jgi:CRP-like cAMP-binding protein